MKLLHTADLHLGKILYEQSLLEDQEHILNQIADELAHGYDFFLIAGDLFDRSVPPPQAVALWDDFLVHVKKRCPELSIIVIPGNHDGAQRLSFASRFLEDQNIYLCTEFREQPLRLKADGQNWDFYPVPFLQTFSLNDGEGLKTQSQLWEAALKTLHNSRDPDVPAILIAHLLTLGGQGSDSERLFLGEAEQIPAPWLEGWNYVALGHLHRCQEPLPNVFYSGSPLAYSFSESSNDKKMLKVEFSDAHPQARALVTPLKLTPLRPMSRLKGNYLDFLQNPAWEAWKDHWVEVTLNDAQLVAQPVEKLRPIFPRLLSLIQNPLLETSGQSSGIHRSSGNLETDFGAFLQSLGLEYGESEKALVHQILKEAQNEAP